MEGSDRQKMKEKLDRLEEEIKILRVKMIEQGKLEDQLRQSQKMEALANLSAGIAHDFNNILQSILGYTQIALLKKTNDDPDLRIFNKIEICIAKGNELTKQFLTFGRKIEPKFTPLNLNHKINEINKLLRRTIPRMIEIDLMLSDDLKMINADSGQIEQILMNLSINARDAMPNGGKLIFKTKNILLGDKQPLTFTRLKTQPHEYLLLTVSDTGVGMPSKTMGKIFEPFFTTKERGKGTGLGLSMVYSIVKNHNGFIDCSSKDGEGTTFSIYFPILNPDRIQSNSIEQNRKGKIPGGNETILFIDDESELLNLGKEMLEKFGYRVIIAETGEDGINKYSHNTIDLVILDIGMPGMGGIKCLQQLLSIDKKAKVLISSGYSLNGRVEEALALGVKAFLAKPYTVNELLEIMRVVLNGD